MKLDWERAQGLYKDALIAKSEYDMRKNAWESADAGVAQAQARIAQAKAQRASAEQHISEGRANLIRVSDVLQKTSYNAPFDGMITNLAGSRRRDRRHRHSEFSRQHADDASPTCP